MKINLSNFSFSTSIEIFALWVGALSSKIDIFLFLKFWLFLIYFFRSVKNSTKILELTDQARKWMKYSPVENTAAIIEIDSLNPVHFISASFPFFDHEYFLAVSLEIIDSSTFTIISSVLNTLWQLYGE